MATIVVGVDGSTGGQAALRFAVAEARLRGADVRAVTAWHMSTMAYGGGFGPGVDPTAFEESANASLERALAALGDEAKGVEITRALRMGQPAQVLVEEGSDADLLVVGSRGHGGFAGLLLGSVSHQCALHARCPVVIVHEPRPADSL